MFEQASYLHLRIQYRPSGYFSSTMMSQIRAALSAWVSALVLASDSEVFLILSSSAGHPTGPSSFCLRSSSRFEMNPSSAVDPNFLFKFDFNEDFLFSSADETDCFELLASFSPIRLLVESLRMDPLEHSTSSEKETREFLDDRLEAAEEAEEETEEEEEVLSGLTGTTTGDSAEQFSQLATLSRASLATVPSSLQKLSLASRLWPCSRSRYCRLSVKRSR